ncbi:hypothetical protein [Dawidia soli]|uniref:Lipoprotein n=1 Tax=Dawidia soli TaxID=2782352 RepID=A0AAP2GGD0_9BACT|nr:hypothetical protein [Dawidia soli]MBT1690472.1 hypothetical protein [Dawidia soli]
MKTTLFVVAGFLLVCGCEVAKDLYIDDHEITGPEAITVTKVYAGVARFIVSQEIATTTDVPPRSFSSRVVVEREAQEERAPLAYLVRLYTDSLQLSEGLVVTRRRSVPDLLDTLVLGGAYQTVLALRNVELIVLDAGGPPEDQVQERGYYTGTYSATKDDGRMAVGRVSGYIEYNGHFRFEFDGTDAFRFLSGNGIHDGTGFRVNANLTTTDRTVVTPLHDLISYSADTLTGDFDMAAAGFDHLQFLLTKNP